MSSTILSIAFGLAVALLAIPSNLVPSFATSLPSTVPVKLKLPEVENKKFGEASFAACPI